METVAIRVQRGIALLDMRRPGWQEKVDRERLDMDSITDGLIEQVFGCPFGYALHQLGIGHKEAYRCGFDIEEGTPEEQYEQQWQVLTEAWKQMLVVLS